MFQKILRLFLCPTDNFRVENHMHFHPSYRALKRKWDVDRPVNTTWVVKRQFYLASLIPVWLWIASNNSIHLTPKYWSNDSFQDYMFPYMKNDYHNLQSVFFRGVF